MTPSPNGATTPFDASLLCEAPARMIALLTYARKSGASDVHLAVGTVARVRADGAIRQVPEGDPWRARDLETVLRTLVGEQNWTRFELDLELDARIELSGTIEVNLFRQRGAVAAVLTLVNEFAASGTGDER